MTSWRPLNDRERAVLARLLEKTFPGRTELASQLNSPSLRARVCDAEGSIELTGNPGPAASVRSRVPVEASALDADGTRIHALLHVVNGFATELEFYKDDGIPILDWPSLDRWEVEAL